MTDEMHYFSFGQSHVHRVSGKTFDADCLVGIMALSPKMAREKMFEVFGDKWHRQYNEERMLKALDYYPRGIITL